MLGDGNEKGRDCSGGICDYGTGTARFTGYYTRAANTYSILTFL